MVVDTGLKVRASWNPDLSTQKLTRSGEMVGKGKVLSWSVEICVISTKEQEFEKINSLKTFESRDANLSHLLSNFENLRTCNQEESQEDVEMFVSEEHSEHQPMEEEERE